MLPFLLYEGGQPPEAATIYAETFESQSWDGTSPTVSFFFKTTGEVTENVSILPPVAPLFLKLKQLFGECGPQQCWWEAQNTAKLVPCTPEGMEEAFEPKF